MQRILFLLHISCRKTVDDGIRHNSLGYRNGCSGEHNESCCQQNDTKIYAQYRVRYFRNRIRNSLVPRKLDARSTIRYKTFLVAVSTSVQILAILFYVLCIRQQQKETHKD